MRNLKLTLSYDGTRYLGWQIQPQGPTIQGELERAIGELTGETVSVLSAGRTDSGVHALAQVASCRTASKIPAANWPSALQTHLPFDIVIRDAADVPDEFHATFSARRKRYRYVIHNGPAPLPFLRNYVYSLRRDLDASAMHQAAQCLVGTHDFRSFETDWPNKATSVRTVFDVTVRRAPGWDLWSCGHETIPDPGDADEARRSARTTGVSSADESAGDYVVLEIEADGFLYNMVRSITGTLINVGRGKWSAEDVHRILHAQNRTQAGATAPASGLYLVRVKY